MAAIYKCRIRTCGGFGVEVRYPKRGNHNKCPRCRFDLVYMRDIPDQPVTYNNSGFSDSEIVNMARIGSFQNYWRRRTVHILRHPSDPAKVVTVGHAHDNSAIYVCTEAASEYKRQLVHDDWDPFN